LWESVHLPLFKTGGTAIASKKGERYMAKFHKYVQIGPPTATASGRPEKAMVKVIQKYPNVIAVLEGYGSAGIDWIKVNAPEHIGRMRYCGG